MEAELVLDPLRRTLGTWKGEDNHHRPYLRGEACTQPFCLNATQMAIAWPCPSATLKSDPHDTEWKSRAFEVSDPSGFLLTIFSETSA